MRRFMRMLIVVGRGDDIINHEGHEMNDMMTRISRLLDGYVFAT